MGSQWADVYLFCGPEADQSVPVGKPIINLEVGVEKLSPTLYVKVDGQATYEPQVQAAVKKALAHIAATVHGC